MKRTRDLRLAAFVLLFLPFEVEATRAPRAVPSQTNETHIVYAGGDGSSFSKAVIIEGATSIIEIIVAEERWLTNRYPRCRVSDIIPQSPRKGRIHDTITIRTTKGWSERVYFAFTPESISEAPIDALWRFYIDDVIHPHGNGSRWIYSLTLEDHMKRIDPRRALAYLVAQLDDVRLTNASSYDPWGDGEFRPRRVCDFAARLLLDDLRYARSKEPVFPQYSWRPFKPSRVMERSDEAIEAIRNWWRVEGQFLTERGEVEWGMMPLHVEATKPERK